MPLLLLLALITLAAFRLTRLITLDMWPPADWFRDWVNRRTGDTSGWSYLVQCPHCAGMYMCAIVMVPAMILDGYWHEAPLGMHFIEWLAICGAQSFLASLTAE